MEFADVIQMVVGEGAMTALAVAALWMLDRAWKQRLEESNRYAATLKEMQEQMRQSLDRNTEAWSRMLERVEGK